MKKTVQFLKDKATRYSVIGGGMVTSLFYGTPVFAEEKKIKDLPDPSGIKDYILGFVGTCLIIFIAIGAFRAFVQQAWGRMVGLIGGGVIVGWICYYPDKFVAFIKAIIDSLLQ